MLPRRERAVVAHDAAGRPTWFLFDTIAFWEFICRLDERMFGELSDKDYDAVSVGPLIDTLEKDWPFSEKYRKHAKQEYERALKEIQKGNMRSVI